MRYSPYTADELTHLNNGLYAGGHTDSCAITLLFRQPIAALQIKDPKSGIWKWAKPMDNSLTVNAGDCLSILTGNYIKSTVHRVSATLPFSAHSHDWVQMGITPTHEVSRSLFHPWISASTNDWELSTSAGHLLICILTQSTARCSSERAAIRTVSSSRAVPLRPLEVRVPLSFRNRCRLRGSPLTRGSFPRISNQQRALAARLFIEQIGQSHPSRF